MIEDKANFFHDIDRIDIKSLIKYQVFKILDSASLLNLTKGSYNDELSYESNVNHLFYIVNDYTDELYDLQMKELTKLHEERWKNHNPSEKTQAYWNARINLAKKKFMYTMKLLRRINFIWGEKNDRKNKKKKSKKRKNL